MPRLITVVSLLITVFMYGSVPAADGQPTIRPQGTTPARVGLYADPQPTVQSLNKMPLSFTKNMGQWDDRVLFRANSGGATMWFTKEGVTYQFTRRIDNGDLDDRRGTLHVPAGTPQGVGQNRLGFDAADLDSRRSLPRASTRGGNDMERDSIETLILTAKIVGANPNPEVIAEGQMEYRCNYFLGNDPSKWHTDVPNYEAITLKDIYPGIDLKYSGDANGQAAYKFIAAPGADIAQIKVDYDGAESTSLDDEGRLILKTKWGDMIAAMDSPRPVGEGSRVRALLSGSASCAWLTSSSDTSPLYVPHGNVRQVLAGNSGTLALAYSTYLRGRSYGIDVDSQRNAYITGYELSSYSPYYVSGWDVFVTKSNTNGSGLIYTTFIGGDSDDVALDIVVGDLGNAYVVGQTGSPDFPTLGAFQAFQGDYDAFVMKLNAMGDSLIYSTCLGGSGNDCAFGIAVDIVGNAYVTGETDSHNFPTQNAFQSTFRGGGIDAFVTKLSSAGSYLIYSTYLGGTGGEGGWDISIDGQGNAYIMGATSSSNFPTLNPYQTDQGGTDVFVTKFSSSGDSLVYSTYIGGSSHENRLGGGSIAVDSCGSAYITGTTESFDFPVLNPFQNSSGGGEYNSDAFVVKVSNSGSNLVFSSYLGGDGDDSGEGIAVDHHGNVYVSGVTRSTNFPTLNPYQAYEYNGIRADDAFVTKIDGSGSVLTYSTYLRGLSIDWASDVAVDEDGNAYVTGTTWSPDFPTQNPYLNYPGRRASFVTKLTWTPDYTCGDVNTDEQVDLLDAVFLVNYIFVGGSAPRQLSLADVDCSGRINIADVVRLINYIFSNGPAPCAGCE